MKRSLRLFLTRYRALLVSTAQWVGNFFRRLRPQIGGFGSLRMCPSCGLITSKYKKLCLECGKSLTERFS